MTRQKLVERVQERLNDLARTPTLSTLIQRCLGEEILPSRKSHPWKFGHDEIFGNLYVSQRDGDDGLAQHTNATDFQHEAYLDKLFWEENPAYAKIFLLGDVGCGKSTLIDYCLRCYCPARGSKRQEFEKALVIHLDAIEYPDIADSTENFYYHTQGPLRAGCADRGIGLEALVRSHFLLHTNARQWVLLALEQLSQLRGKGPGARLKYLVLVLDNLDQCDVGIQKKFLTIAEGWLRSPTIKLWRVLVPLWPSTLKKLQNQDFGPTRAGVEFRVGSVPLQDILERRAHALAAELGKSHATAGHAEDVVSYIGEMYSLVRPRILPRVNAICNDNLRRKLRIWKGFVSGESARTLWHQVVTAPDKRRSYEYELLDAILCGAHDGFAPEYSGIANVFTLGHAHCQPRDLLIGLHALVMLDHGIERRSSLYTSLMRLGYHADNIRAADHALRLFNVYHEVPTSSGPDDDPTFEVHPAVVRGTLTSAWSPPTWTTSPW
jgi:hypothetical protein